MTLIKRSKWLGSVRIRATRKCANFTEGLVLRV